MGLMAQIWSAEIDNKFYNYEHMLQYLLLYQATILTLLLSPCISLTLGVQYVVAPVFHFEVFLG